MTQEEPYQPGEYQLYGMTAGRMPVITEDDAKVLRRDLRRKVRKGEDYEGSSIVSLVRENPLFLAGISDATLIARANGKDYHRESVRFGALQAYDLIESTFLRRFLESGEGHRVIPQVSESHSERTLDVTDAIYLIKKTLEKEYGPDASRKISPYLGLVGRTNSTALDEAQRDRDLFDHLKGYVSDLEIQNRLLTEQLSNQTAQAENYKDENEQLKIALDMASRSEQLEFQSE